MNNPFHKYTENFGYKVLWKLITRTHVGRLLSDKLYLKIQYRRILREKLNLDNPQKYNEKLQWLKLYNRRPEYTALVDKYEVKPIIAKQIGEEHIIKTLGVWDNFDDIDFNTLPNQFVLKCTHDSGGLVICKDKSQLNKIEAKRKIEASLKSNFFYFSREWPYKDVKPRIIAEEYMEDETGELKDFKFFCFNGEPKALFIASDRQDKNEETKFDFFDMDFKHLPFRGGHPNATKPIPCPNGFEEMKRLAKILSAGMPHVRVDFYDIDGHIYFGEMTFFHWSGMAPFDPQDWNCKFGEWLKLPEKYNS